MNDVRDVMIDNLDKILERGARLEVIIESSEQLKETGAEFRTGTRTVKRRYTCILISIIIAIIVVILIVILAIVLIVCGATSCWGKKK
jgi:t-SNARE complex subunit (syntaxin)